MLVHFDWPGNVRQLKNVVERLVIMADERIVDQTLLQGHLEMRRDPSGRNTPETLQELKAVKKRLIEEQYGRIERAFLQNALAAEAGNITRAARRVGMQRSNFSALMKKHHLTAASMSPSASDA
jgi:two-component system NtrC family response regulator